jgi:hypothetical protein
MIATEVKGKKAATLKLLKDLVTSAHDYAKIGDYTLWPDDPAYDSSFEAALNDLRLFRVTQCNPILLNAIQRFNRPKDIAAIFKIVVNFSFRYFIIGNQSPGNLERVSNSIAVGIRLKKLQTPAQVADEFRSINPDTTFRADFELAVMPKGRAKIARHTLAKLTNFLSTQTSTMGSEQIANPDAKRVTSSMFCLRARILLGLRRFLPACNRRTTFTDWEI